MVRSIILYCCGISWGIIDICVLKELTLHFRWMWWPLPSLPVVYTADPTRREWRESSSDRIWYDSHWNTHKHADNRVNLISISQTATWSLSACECVTWTGPAWSRARPAVTGPGVSDTVPSTSGPGSCHLDEILTALNQRQRGGTVLESLFLLLTSCHVNNKVLWLLYTISSMCWLIPKFIRSWLKQPLMNVFIKSSDQCSVAHYPNTGKGSQYPAVKNDTMPHFIKICALRMSCIALLHSPVSTDKGRVVSFLSFSFHSDKNKDTSASGLNNI